MALVINFGNFAITMRLYYRIQFLIKISNNIYSFIRLTSALLLYSVAVRIKKVKTFLLSRDAPFLIDVKFFEEDLSLKLRMQDIAIFVEIFQEEAYSLPITPQVNANTIDLGAHIGFTSLYFFLKHKLQGRFVLVEPSSDNFELLKYNTQIIENKSLQKIAIADESGSIHFTNENHFGHNHHVSDKGTPMHCISIDDLLSQENINFCDLLKMDIEGVEKRILMKSDHSIWKDKIGILILEMHFGNDEFENLVSEKGFTFRKLNQNMYLLERAS